ncbi:hypothetical protein CTI12_AA259110 [Artemisia annua]|uniref:Homologous recombination OB-fold protein OB-fold domain-containing protein n=1 Tax=Artemisia annua TaxID=35608 RepID=A0A2U1NJB7_ARTAN|nr:hypothetical protein CTI12_AA259110 [Artemisia annua]
MSLSSPEKEVRIIPGPAGIVQLAKRHKQADISEGRQERVISTQEYIRTVLEDVEVDEDFSHGPWLSTVDFVNANGGWLTLKDLSGSMPGAIHHKIINEEGGYRKDIHVGAAVIVHNVSVFSPNRSYNSLHYLNITKKNLVKVFHKDTLYGSGSGEVWELGLSGYVSDSFSDSSEEERFRIEPEEDWELGWCGKGNGSAIPPSQAKPEKWIKYK